MSEGQRQEVPPAGAKYEFNEEERRVMQECRVESFYYRCVPISFLLIGSTQILVNKGWIKPHPKYGALFKNMGAAFVGYIIGKASYVGTCRNKLLQLDNSPLANQIRGRRMMPQMEPSMVPTTDDTPMGNNQLGTYNSGDNIDTERQQAKGLDDSFRPNIDTDSDRLNVVKPQQEMGSSYTNYDDLRKRNRDTAAVQQPQGSPATEYKPPTRNISRLPDDQPVKRVRRNQYGDIIEE